MKKRFICRATPDGTLKFARKRFKIEKVFSINIKLGGLGYKNSVWINNNFDNILDYNAQFEKRWRRI